MAERDRVPALKVKQWLDWWDSAPYDADAYRDQPEENFYLFSMSAKQLLSLVGIERRSIEGGVARSADLAIQRRHDRARSNEISLFVRYGYPWSDLSERRRNSGKYNELRKPGWLPTAIIVNVRGPINRRTKEPISESDRILIEESGGAAELLLPEDFSENWSPEGVHPLEVIDGQHRLWAFEHQVEQDFQLPVVAFDDLDISWQAYLFWTINIRPKRINASLAFDLYPLLRTEDWLERFEGHSIYRESRAQELTEALWSYEHSPWFRRINMLGESKGPSVSQAAWIRALMATFVRRFDGGRSGLGGLFGAPVGEDQLVLPWTRVQQAAFLILAWQLIQTRIEETAEPWAEHLRENAVTTTPDPAFFGPHALLNSDQGVQGVLRVLNDMLYIRASELDLKEWEEAIEAEASDPEAISETIERLKDQKAAQYLDQIARNLAPFDWRKAAAPGLDEAERTAKMAFRGTGGYKELERQVLQQIAQADDDSGEAARTVMELLGFTTS